MLSDVFKYFGGTIIFLGVVAGFTTFASDVPFLTSVIILIGTASFGLLFIGFGAMLHSLHRIELKVAGQEPPFVSSEESAKLPGNVKK